MNHFIKKALEKLPRMDKAQIQEILKDLLGENELLEMAFQSINLGVFVCDNRDKILFANKTAERLLPLSSSDILDRPLLSVINDGDLCRFLEQALEKQETISSREFSMDTRGKVQYINLSLLPLVKNGRIMGSILQIFDITERKNRETRLRRAESLASLTTLAAGVAHEIKNPLGSIGIHLQLAQKALKPEGGGRSADKHLHRYLEVIQEEVDRLNGIVVDFLFAVRPMDTTLVDGSLQKVLREIVEFLREEMRQAGIEVRMNLDDDCIIPLDERFLKQAFLNLIKNSQYAMLKGGRIDITTRTQVESIVVTIVDTGVGIPEENLEKIFEPYFTTRDFGSGLGLTLVYKIVKEHGADIQVKSKVGVGTSVILTFPRPQQHRALLEYGGVSN